MSLLVLAPMRIEAAAAARGATTARVVRTGVGQARSRRAAGLIVADAGAPDTIGIVGVCGGLADGLVPGDIVVADELRSTAGDATSTLAHAPLLVAELLAAGLPVRVGALITAPRPVIGARRAALARLGAIAVDMESAWLAAGVRAADSMRPLAVIRVVVDAPGHELWSPHTMRRLRLAADRVRDIVPVLERWDRAVHARRVVLASPRSFCAGVERAVDVVGRALDRYGAPVYVRRQIVHNTHVVGGLERRGAIFVGEVDAVPEGGVLVLAAHGVAPEVRRDAEARWLRVIDATCPLVAKVHTEARRFAAEGRQIVLIGHDDHEEVVGTLGEARAAISIVASHEDIDRLEIADPARVAYLTQTTLAVDEVDDLVDHLRRRFPALVGPRRDDICYATQNRQEAVAALAPDVDVVLVVGSSNSSNSRRLTEVAQRMGTPAHLVDGWPDVRLAWLEGATTVGITAGASAPESKVREIVHGLRSLGPVTVEERQTQAEAVSFPLPVEVR
jgi:4-hydroxy-3-methylbut-2-en-1-yl diphosphate reductase